jgi:hypothetical protein
MLWNMVDAREKTNLYEKAGCVMDGLGLSVLNTNIPDVSRLAESPLKLIALSAQVCATLSADNLYCLTSYSGLDPELSNSDGTTAGLDKRDKYPITKSFTFGVNVTF